MSDFMYEGDAMLYGGADGDEQPPTPEEQPSSPGKTLAHTLFDYVELIVLTIAIIFFCTLFLFRHAIVDGDSMNGTLKDEEHLIISDLFYQPKAGDIVVVDSKEETGIDGPIIKRVIAVEGDVVTIYSDGVYVNGVALDEPYVHFCYNTDYISYGNKHNCPGATLDENGIPCYTYIVGEGEIFLMGDNRFNSTDSRMFGCVSEKCILGRVLLRIYPFSGFGGVN